jgi:hypothetical protein
VPQLSQTSSSFIPKFLKYLQGSISSRNRTFGTTVQTLPVGRPMQSEGPNRIPGKFCKKHPHGAIAKSQFNTIARPVHGPHRLPTLKPDASLPHTRCRPPFHDPQTILQQRGNGGGDPHRRPQTFLWVVVEEDAPVVSAMVVAPPLLAPW